MTPKKKMGRPSLYRSEYADQVGQLTADGATDEQLAVQFGVTVKTIHNWKLSEPDFVHALKAGKREADSEIVTSLFKRAQGFEYQEEVPIKCKTVLYDQGKRISETERVEVTLVTRVVPPDTTACIFWLKNRQQAAWRDIKATEVTGKDGGALDIRIVRI